jgi:hypothetical protein
LMRLNSWFYFAARKENSSRTDFMLQTRGKKVQRLSFESIHRVDLFGGSLCYNLFKCVYPERLALIDQKESLLKLGNAKGLNLTYELARQKLYK